MLSRLNQIDRRRIIHDEASVSKQLQLVSWTEQAVRDTSYSHDAHSDDRSIEAATVNHRHAISRSVDHGPASRQTPMYESDRKASIFRSVRQPSRDDAHKRNCNDRSRITDTEHVREASYRSKATVASARKKILRQKFPEIGGLAKPFPKQWEGPKKSEYAKQLDKETDHLYSKIFYYKFQRNLALQHDEDKILKELKENAKVVGKENLVVISRPETPGKVYEFGEKPRRKRKAPRVFGLVKIEEDEDDIFTKTKEDEASSDDRPRYIDRDKNAERTAMYYKYQDMGRFKVVFDDPYQPPKVLDPSLDDTELKKNLDIQRKQKLIYRELEEYEKVVTDVFMTENAKKKQTEIGLITVTVVDEIIEGMRNLDKTFQLESRMQGFYHVLEQVTFFRMFKIREALEAFSRCKLFTYKKGTQFMFTKQSQVVIILRGNMIINEPDPIETDKDGNILPETLKVTKVKGGYYENMYFIVKDGDYINNNVFKFMDKNNRTIGTPVKCTEECLTLQLANDDLTKDHFERVARSDFYNVMDYLCKHRVFQYIGHINLSRISKQIIHFKYSVGEPIFNKNEVSDGVYVLIRGAASITYRDDFIDHSEANDKNVPSEIKMIPSPQKKQKK